MKQNPITICFISLKAYNIFNPTVGKVFGGAEVDLYYLATELAKDTNYIIKFIVADYGQANEEVIENVTLLKSMSFEVNHFKRLLSIWKTIKKADAQIYIIKTASMGAFLTALFCKFNKRKFIYRTAHSNECNGNWAKKNPLRAPFFKWALKQASIIFTQNECDKDNLMTVYGLNSISLPNGHRIITPQNKERKFILWVGRSVVFKRPELFIEIAKNMPDCNFKMVCQCATGDNKYDRLEKMAKEYNNLEFIHKVSFKEIDKLFSQAKLFINTSTIEGFPNTYIQACLAGTPIAALSVNPDNFIETYNCGICANDNLNTVYKFIRKLDNTDYYRLLSDNAIKYVKNKHDISQIVDSYKSIINQMLK